MKRHKLSLLVLTVSCITTGEILSADSSKHQVIKQEEVEALFEKWTGDGANGRKKIEKTKAKLKLSTGKATDKATTIKLNSICVDFTQFCQSTIKSYDMSHRERLVMNNRVRRALDLPELDVEGYLDDFQEIASFGFDNRQVFEFYNKARVSFDGLAPLGVDDYIARFFRKNR